jgi:hypothetical protein
MPETLCGSDARFFRFTDIRPLSQPLENQQGSLQPLPVSRSFGSQRKEAPPSPGFLEVFSDQRLRLSLGASDHQLPANRTENEPGRLS